MEKEIFEQPSVLTAIRGENESELHRLTLALEEKKPSLVYFAARGTSDHASMYAGYLLGIYKGIPSALSLPSVVTLYDGMLCLKDALVIGVSQSGKAADVLDVIKRANRDGAITVAVTNDPASPMAQQAAFRLSCAAGEEVSVAATKTFTSQMYVLAMFVAQWSRNSALCETLEKVPKALEVAIHCFSDQLERVIQRYRYMRDGFVLARGTSYPIALEAALKLQETNYVRMKGYAISDFYHGPLAQIEQGTPVMLFAGKGPCYSNALEILQKLDEIGAEVILVSDNAELTAGRDLSFSIPDLGSDAGSPFLFAAFAQMFACRLSMVKGLDPDAPRNLKKVTITV